MTAVNATSYWFVISAALWAMVFLLTPLKVLRSILLPGFVMGFLGTYLLNFPAVNWLRLWRFSDTALMVANVPLGLALGWYAGIVLFYLFILSYPRLQIAAVILASLFTAALFTLSDALGHLRPIHWTPVETGLLALTTHVVALKFLRLFFPEKIPPPQKPPI